MAEKPLRLRILEAVTAALEEITPANGYYHDMSGRVRRGRVIFGRDDEPPFISILEAPIPLESAEPPRNAAIDKGPWELLIQGFVKDDIDHPTDPAHYLLADVRKRLAVERRKTNWRKPEDGPFGFGKFVDKLRIGAGVVGPADEISPESYFWLVLALDIVEDLSDPYED